MNSYQRRQRMRRPRFALTKIAKAAERAAKGLGLFAESVARLKQAVSSYRVEMAG